RRTGSCSTPSRSRRWRRASVARALTSGIINACTAANCRPFLLFEGVFDGSTVRLWDGMGGLSWDSQAWGGNGWVQGTEGGEESVEVEANDMVVILSGVPSSAVSLVLGNQVQGATGKVWLGMLDTSGAVIADPYLRWLGYYSHADVEGGPDDSTIR